MSRVVSLTPSRLDRDSRTLKQASSVARLGHESVVVEAVKSAEDPTDAPFEVVTLRSVGESLASSEAASPTLSRGIVERIAELLGRVAGPLYFLASFAAFNLATARRLPDAHLYWLHGYEQYPAVALRRRPYVYDAHDLYAALPHDGRALSWQERATHSVRLAIERACARHARVRVTTSEPMARACERRLGVPFEVVRNAQDARIAQPSPTDVRTAAGVGPDTFLIVMVGQHKPGTIVPDRVPDGAAIAFVGEGYAETGPPPPGVHFLGAVPPEEVMSFISAADAAALFYAPVSANSPLQLVNGLFHAVSAGLPLLYPAGMHAIAEVAERHGLGVAFDPREPLGPPVAALRAGMPRYLGAVAAARAELDWRREETRIEAILERALR